VKPAVRMREDRARQMAIDYGIPANAVIFAETGVAAQATAQQLGCPVAIKLVADDVVHKSKAGGVLLGVHPDTVAEETDRLLAAQRANGAQVRGVTVEAMVASGLEVVVGALRDRGFGPVVMFGHGGVDVETLDDVAFALAPITRQDALALVLQTRIGRVVQRRLADRVEDLVDLLLAVGGHDGLLLHEAVTEVDFNPVVVSTDKVVAVDARATALTPAPAEFTLPDPIEMHTQLSPALYPSSIAVLGASSDARKMGYRAVKTLVDFGFAGEIYPVSRSGGTICGIPALTSVGDLPIGVDRAVVALPAQAVPQALADLAERGARTAHVYSADAPALDPNLKSRGLRVLGPNCVGHYSPRVGVTMIAPDASSPEPGHVAMVSQSGTYAGDVVRRGNELGIKFSFVTSVGNCDDVSPSELLACCAADDTTRVIAFYLEDDRDAGRFFRLARTVTKPVVLLKGGRTLAGGAAAASHTGALASEPQLLEDAARQAGVVLVDTLDELLDVLLVLQHCEQVAGDGLGLVGSGGGVAVVGSDTAHHQALTLPHFSAATQQTLARFQAPGSSLNNPIDIPIWSLFDEAGSITGSLIIATAADDAVQSICAYLDLGTVFDLMSEHDGCELVRSLVQDLVDAPRKSKPLVLVLRSSFSPLQDDLIRRLRPIAAVSGVPLIDSADRAIVALGKVRALTRHGKTGKRR